VKHFRVGHALPARQSREVFRDTDTGVLHPMQVMDTSFSTLGLAAGNPSFQQPPYSAAQAPPSSAGYPYPAPATNYTLYQPSSQQWSNVANPTNLSPEMVTSPWGPAESGSSYSSPSGWGATEPPGSFPPANPASMLPTSDTRFYSQYPSTSTPAPPYSSSPPTSSSSSSAYLPYATAQPPRGRSCSYNYPPQKTWQGFCVHKN
jgi:hypothetical protein